MLKDATIMAALRGHELPTAHQVIARFRCGYQQASRCLEALREEAMGLDAAVASPPYAEGLGHGGGTCLAPHDTKGTAQAMTDGYGEEPGQIGGMKETSLEAAITSPPYANGCTREGEEHHPDRMEGTSETVGFKSYGDTSGQIGALKDTPLKPLPPVPACAARRWDGCYDQGWKGVIVDGAFAHPAKMSRGLLRKILAHGFERGWWQKGSRIGDCFGGIGTTAIEGTYAGLRVVSVELEPKFWALSHENLALHAPHWRTLGLPLPTLLQGDSRQFDHVIEAAVTSPPFCVDQPCASQSRLNGNIQGPAKRESGMDTEGNIQHSKQTTLEAAIASPPFNTREDGGGIAQSGETTTKKLGRSTLSIDAAVASPPYATIAAGAGGLNHLPAKEEGQQTGRVNGPSQDTDTRYGETDGQIAGTREEPLEAAITSPPWESNAEGHMSAHKWKDPKKVNCKSGHGCSPEARLAQLERDKEKTYGDSPGQIGQTHGKDTCYGCGVGIHPYECEPVKIADVLLALKAAGVSDTMVPTSAAQECLKPKSTKRKSPPLTSTCLTRSTLQNDTESGREEIIGGEDTHGESSAGNVSNETATNAKNAEPQKVSSSTTDEISQRPEECGITISEIFRRFAAPAMADTTDLKCASFPICAKCAERLTHPRGQLQELALRVAKLLLTRRNTSGGEQKKRESYWQAVRLCYEALYRCLKPGGISVLVVKDYVRDKKRVRLCDDTLRLLCWIGFEPVERIQAMLVHEEHHGDFFDESKATTKKERKSFFRRLYEGKLAAGGDDRRIDWEECLVVRKPLQ